MGSVFRGAGRRVSALLPVPPVTSSPRMPGLLPRTSGAGHAMSAYSSAGTLHAIVAKLAQAVAAPEWHLYRKPTSSEGERVEVFSHAILTVLNNPNKFYTRFELFEAYQQHIDLTGEGVFVVGRDPRFPSIPLELWVVRPDRIEPVQSGTEFISGYIYYGPKGEKIPLEASEVIVTKLPNPLDPYRGMGPVQSILTEIDSSRYTAEWNLNFFKNSAEPGGIIAVPRRLSNSEWEEMKTRWDEQHKGVSRAHRVAILENAQWVERKFTHRDMQFIELRQHSDELIRTAFSFPRPMLGTVDDTNRANMEAAQSIFDTNCSIPRLDRLRSTLNFRFLPLFGETAKGLELDYESPAMENWEAENAKRINRAETFKILIDSGVEASDAAAYCELPDFAMAPKPEPVVVAPPEQDDDEDDGPPRARARSRRTRRIRDAEDLDDEDLPDIEQVQVEWEAALAGLLVSFSGIVAGWFDTLVEQVAALAGYTPGYSSLRLPTLAGVEVLTQAMIDTARSAALGPVREAEQQGVTLLPGTASADALAVRARVVVEHLGVEYALSAGREALRTGGDPQVLRDFLDTLTEARQELHLGAALTQAQHAGRMATHSLGLATVDGPVPAFYSSEVLDRNTCDKCREVHGKWLGNDLSTDVPKTYPMGGFIACKGRQRCRGQVVVVWRPGADRSKWMEKEPL